LESRFISLSPFPAIKGNARASPDALEDDAKLATVKRDIVDGVEADALPPQISKMFPFDKMTDAPRYLGSNKKSGKVVVTI
jgi:NADPH:quinone reductase-like Zn-dependent oxidoreductase